MSVREEMAWAMFRQFWQRQGGEPLRRSQIRQNWTDLSEPARRAWLLRADTAIDVVLRVEKRCGDLAALRGTLMEGRR